MNNRVMCDAYGHIVAHGDGTCVYCDAVVMPTTPTDPPSFLYRVVDKNGDASAVAYTDSRQARRWRADANERFPLAAPHTIQRTQVRWEDVGHDRIP